MPIVDASANEAPSFVHNHIYVGQVGESYSLTLSATDSEGGQLSFRTTYLPEWLLKTETTESTVTISGTPSEQYEGVNFFSVQVSYYHVSLYPETCQETGILQNLRIYCTSLTVHTAHNLQTRVINQR